MEQKPLQHKLAQFGRALVMLCNRALMYQKSHPVVRQSIEEVQKEADTLFAELSPVVFILNRDLFYVDEVLVDPRINVSRIAAWFKANNVQSLSFEKGITVEELTAFSGIFALGKTMDVQVLKESLAKHGVNYIKINHVVYKKVSEDDQVIAREILKKATPLIDAEDRQNRQRFMESLLESVLTEEFAKTLNITSLMSNPVQVSNNMIAADLAGAAVSRPGAGGAQGNAQATGESSDPVGGHAAAMGGTAGPGGMAGAGGSGGVAAGSGAAAGGEAQNIMAGGVPGGSPGSSRAGAQGQGGHQVHGEAAGAGQGFAGQGPGPGPAANQGVGSVAAMAGGGAGGAAGALGHGHLLLHQLEVMQSEVTKHLQGQGEVDLGDLAAAVFDMKKQLLEGIQAQKALGVAYANEADIMARADELTDQVLLELIKEEYQAGRITTARLAYLIKRLVPEADELKRLLPRIKAVLLGEGMAMDEYLHLLRELTEELQGDDLARILRENFEALGIDGKEMMGTLKGDPELAAKLMYMAAEIRKGGGDEAELTNLLVDYIETSAGRLMQATGAQDQKSETRIKTMVTGIGSDMLSQLGRLNVNQDALGRLEKRLTERMDALLDNMRVEWLQSKASSPGPASTKAPAMTVLQTLEQHVGDDEELDGILKILRAKVEGGEIEANNYSQIHAEICRQKELLKAEGGMRPGGGDVLNSDELFYILAKEIACNKRYGRPVSALALSIVSAQAGDKSAQGRIDSDAVVGAALEMMVGYFREVDMIGRIGKNKIVVVLPMTDQVNAKSALARVLRQMHARPMDMDGIGVQLRIAGVAAEYDAQLAPDAAAFAKHLATQLTDMVTRLKNIQVLF